MTGRAPLAGTALETWSPSPTAQSGTNQPGLDLLNPGNPALKPAIATCFLDPWGNRYLYYYKAAPAAGRPPANAWRPSAYVLYSAGPDGQQTAPNATTGLYTGTTQTTGTNADNIYANP